MGDERCEGEEDRGGVVRWERFLPRVSVTVLLVESDDSTRQIIAALLRKCSYRVTAVSDGLKAWETLNNKSHYIDLVLTEVEVPSISGFALLSMIMDHENCKNIPVIMMSSCDSMNMVFKCMSKGAADFLVKPIRRNELRNLWQHVWRRDISSGRRGWANGHQDENFTKKVLDDHSGEYVAPENKSSCEKGSDTQSSCTRSDMENENTYMQNICYVKPHHKKDLPPMITLGQDSVVHSHSDSASLVHQGEAGDKSMKLGLRVSTFNISCNSSEPSLEEDQSCEILVAMDEDKPCNEVIDLIGELDNQRQFSYGTRGISRVQNGLCDASLTLARDVKCKSSSVPHLELSLRYQQSSYDKLENDEWNTLNHSNSSAFYLFNCSPVVPTPLRSPNACNEHECFDTSNLSIEGTKPQGLGIDGQEGMAVRCSPLQVMPFPVPDRGMALDSLCTMYGAELQPIYYPKEVRPLWNTIPSTGQDFSTANPSDQSHRKDFNSRQSHHQDDQSNKQREEASEERDEQRRVSPVTYESGSSGCNVNISANSLKTSTQGACCEEQLAPEVFKPQYFHRLSQREAAVKKFRMKRKERCFDKKVRYHSRKRLAEQRPRVKGQFVRQAQSDSQSMIV